VSSDGQGLIGSSDAQAPDSCGAAEDLDDERPGTLDVVEFPMPAGTTFHWHTHSDHQLAWAAEGVLTVVTESATWVLPPTRALWIPAELLHETSASGRATMRSLYIRPHLFPIAWQEPTPIQARPLLGELVAYLETEPVGSPRRARAEALLVDLLEPVPQSTIEIRQPREARALEVAVALRANPADKRTLEEWGHDIGASERTLARDFMAGTGMSFGRWRTLLRLQAALPGLARGDSVSSVARRVGYDRASAFVAAFRRETGVTPATYFKESAIAGSEPG
jgi:AraC-like DNA-binding protein